MAVFNYACNKMYVSYLRVGDELMSDIRFLDYIKGKLNALVLYFPQV